MRNRLGRTPNPKNKYRCPNCNEGFRLKQTMIQHKCLKGISKRWRREP